MPDDNRKLLNRSIGNLGEDAAVELLKRRGYRILERNWECNSGEIDIIGEHRGVLAFVEVKTRSPRSWFSPAAAVDEVKQGRIRSAAAVYLSKWREPSPRRYDVVSVLLDDCDQIISVELEMSAFGD